MHAGTVRAYTRCLTIDDKECWFINDWWRMVNRSRSISYENFLLFNYLRDRPVNHLHHCISTNVYISYMRAKHPVCEACRRASPLASASRSFILSSSPTRLSPPSISSVRGMNHRSLTSRCAHVLRQSRKIPDAIKINGSLMKRGVFRLIRETQWFITHWEFHQSLR